MCLDALASLDLIDSLDRIPCRDYSHGEKISRRIDYDIGDGSSMQCRLTPARQYPVLVKVCNLATRNGHDRAANEPMNEREQLSKNSAEEPTFMYCKTRGN